MRALSTIQHPLLKILLLDHTALWRKLEIKIINLFEILTALVIKQYFLTYLYCADKVGYTICRQKSALMLSAIESVTYCKLTTRSQKRVLMRSELKQIFTSTQGAF